MRFQAPISPQLYPDIPCFTADLGLHFWRAGAIMGAFAAWEVHTYEMKSVRYKLKKIATNFAKQAVGGAFSAVFCRFLPFHADFPAVFLLLFC